MVLKILISKFLIMSGYQNIKALLQTIPGWSDKGFITKKVKNTALWILLLKKLLKLFTKNNFKKHGKQSLEL